MSRPTAEAHPARTQESATGDRVTWQSHGRTAEGEVVRKITKDAAHKRKAVGYVHRHLAQRPAGDSTDSAWRYSLMNWGHDTER